MVVKAGNPEANLARILAGIERAKANGRSVVVFPEMAVPGYLLGDEWENEAFVRECADMNAEIMAATKDGIAAVWGNVLVDQDAKGEDGRTRKYNAAFVAQNGEMVGNGVFVGYAVKSLMPKYREFDDERHFYSLSKLAFEKGVSPESLLEPFELFIAGVRRRIGIVICEDMWDEDYAFKPVEILKKKGAEAVINLSASPYGIGKSAKRDRLIARHSEGIRFYYANNVGIQNNGKNVFLFDGGSAIAQDGRIIAGARSFCDQEVFEASGIPSGERSEISDVAQGLVAGIREFMAGMDKKKIVIGLSGGIDSAVVATLAVMAMGPENVIAVNMPSKYNSDTTKNLAAQLAKNLRVPLYEVGIQESVDATRTQLEAVLGVPMDEEGRTLNFENVQARDRGSRVLAGIASMVDAVYTNNGNKTEVALGYATLYGDVNGAFAPIADLYKSQVYELARHLNSIFGDPIPKGIIDLIPSAELSVAQNVDEGKGDPFDYPRTDAILRRFVEWRKDPEELLESYLNGTLAAELGLGREVAPSLGTEEARPDLAPENGECLINLGRVPSAWDGPESSGSPALFADAAAFVSEIERLWKLYKINYFKRVQAPPIIAVSKRAFGFDLREAQNGIHFTRRFQALKARILGE
jgi:NAD+ synthase (glutamine-hydrolysing)